MYKEVLDNEFYYNLNENLEEKVESYLSYKKDHKDMKFIINFDFNIPRKKFLSIFNYLKAKKIRPHDVMVNLLTDKLTYTKQELLKIRSIYRFLNKLHVYFGTSDLDKFWKAKDIWNSSHQINGIANKINQYKLSPLEKLIETYLYVTYSKYNDTKEDEHYSFSRSIYGVMNSNKICCLGYSYYATELIKRINDDNIKLYRNHVATMNDKNEIDGLHMNLICHIKDDKYNLNGYYYLDPTWDAGHLDKYIPHFNYFLVPLCDIDKIKDRIRDVNVNLPKEEKHKKSVENVDAKLKNKTKVNKPKANIAQTHFSSDCFHFGNEAGNDFLKLYPQIIKKAKKDEVFRENLGDIHKNDYVYNFIKKTSRPLDLHSFMYALKNVLKAENPKLDDKELYKHLKTILYYNCERAKKKFKSTAKNCFVQYSKIFDNKNDFVV